MKQSISIDIIEAHDVKGDGLILTATKAGQPVSKLVLELIVQACILPGCWITPSDELRHVPTLIERLRGFGWDVNVS